MIYQKWLLLNSGRNSVSIVANEINGPFYKSLENLIGDDCTQLSRMRVSTACPFSPINYNKIIIVLNSFFGDAITLHAIWLRNYMTVTNALILDKC